MYDTMSETRWSMYDTLSKTIRSNNELMGETDLSLWHNDEDHMLHLWHYEWVQIVNIWHNGLVYQNINFWHNEWDQVLHLWQHKLGEGPGEQFITLSVRQDDQADIMCVTQKVRPIEQFMTSWVKPGDHFITP